ncbi:hypothetical protein C8P68_10929 [Mucilaginibacter yixingensis]|uniref:Adhesin domain-containing protein n=1 Tax=Mucilaginibacter yixingensis TaxID=1295612 RepID=A0A2T5J5H6_9SPHI|nr:hypothetical protein [Mucilaginibacter yixingensis]PTQ93157.1 hypothetical protein C8P68_10929 [Mucilaginibacter yixingensis]
MKLRVYKAAGAIVLGLAAFSLRVAAQPAAAPAPAAPQVTAPAPAPVIAAIRVRPHVLAIPAVKLEGMSILTSLDSGMMQDTTYTRKMKELQGKMRELQNQMRDLSREQGRKAADDARSRGRDAAERARDLAERSKDRADRMDKNFDKTFSEKFKDFGQKFQFRFDKGDADLDKRVASGDVKLKTKTYSKSYNVGRDDKLQISNMYGKVTINTWGKNEFKVDVEIKAYADDDDKAQDLLNRVSITDGKDNNAVSFATKIKNDDGGNSFWGIFGSNGKTSVRKAVINYTVYMPAKSALDVTNKYGAVILPDLFGKLNIKNTYGSLVAKTLYNTDNHISVNYGSAGIDYLSGGDLAVSYGSLNLQGGGKLNTQISYGSGKIGKLSASSIINVRYGGLQVDALENAVKSLSVSSDYSPVKLGAVGNADFDVTVHYAGFSYDNDNVSISSKTPSDDAKGWSSTKNYKGKIGKGSAERTIIIKSNYGGVKLDQ